MTAKRVTPKEEDVAPLLGAIERAARAEVATRDALSRTIRAAYEAGDPRPTYKQISDAVKAGGRQMSPDAVRAVIHGRRPSKKETRGSGHGE